MLSKPYGGDPVHGDGYWEGVIRFDFLHREHLPVDKAKRPLVGPDQDFISRANVDGARKPHVERRSLTAGQKAIATALIYPKRNRSATAKRGPQRASPQMTLAR